MIHYEFFFLPLENHLIVAYYQYCLSPNSETDVEVSYKLYEMRRVQLRWAEPKRIVLIDAAGCNPQK
jgi:hypothetical protein